ncbi:MAG: PEP/pyruvate-binding domain-containing protein [Thermoplasmata archaeon]|nr:PEP/pyruvate-binding domain-containing protein [Thermoplasmata archaeon]
MAQNRSKEGKENGIARLIENLIDRKAAKDSQSVSERPEYCIANILVISTEYDYFILDEEGRLKNLLILKHRKEERSAIPNLVHATEDKALDSFSSAEYDAVFIFNPPSRSDVISIASEIKAIKQVPVVLIGRNTPEICGMLNDIEQCPVNWVFTWSGDGKIFLDIIQFLEDSAVTEAGLPRILIANSQPQYYSRLVFEAYKVINDYMSKVIPDGLTQSQKIMRMQHQPRVILATSFDQTVELFNKYKSDIVSLTVDLDIEDGTKKKDTGTFISNLTKDSPDLQVMLLSSESTDGSLDKASFSLLPQFNELVRKGIGYTTLVFRDNAGTEIASADNIRDFENALWSIPIDIFENYIENGDIVRWLEVMMENDLSARVKVLIKSKIESEDLRKKVIAAISEHRKATHRGVITTYSRGDSDTNARFSRIGKGAMGGKARGLAFVDKLINTYLADDVIPGISVKIPRTIVLCSDIFDHFIEDNNIHIDELPNFTDERIAQKFMEADLPAPVLGDIRSFIRGTKAPIVVRSSSLLEDALHHPFAGVYASLLLPNESWEADIRFQELCASIKYVYASVYFQKARTYMASLQDVKEDEKMAVVVQELVGSKHGSIFYPTVSGVAKSFDYYPSGKCKATDGVVNLALGLGKEVVDGGTAYRFCPVHPKTPKHGTMENLLEHSQKDFFAVDLNSYVNIVQRNEDSTMKRFPISVAEPHGSLEHTASTYNHQENRIYPGIGRDGIRVLDFAPMLQLETIPISKLVQVLLRVNELAVDSPVEIEFAMDIPRDDASQPEFYVLQVRSMRSTGQDIEIELGVHEPDNIFCHAAHAMGNGIISGIRDIVYVKRENYDIADNQKIIPQIRNINEKMLKSRTPYILVGPGRWGSTDHWLGIPVNWSDIAGARLIVETPIEERPVDPSQGSHFFHNMVAARTGYLTIIPNTKSIINWEWLDRFTPVEETQHVKHVRLEEPVEIRIDGGRGEGLILKKVESRIE